MRLRPLLLVVLILLCSATLVAVSVAVIAQGTAEALTALAPLPLLGVWTWSEFLTRTVSSRWVAVTWLLMTFACSGAMAGFLREDPTLNRLTHAGTAALCTMMVFSLADLWLNRPYDFPLPGTAHGRTAAAAVPLLTFTMMCTAGMTLEVVEAAATWDMWYPNRWHDTILDLVANTIGAAAATAVCVATRGAQRLSA